MHGSDWKYGFPHKYYVEGIRNPQMGETVAIGERSELINGERVRTPIMGKASALTGKFYTRHLEDLIAQPEFEEVARAIFEKNDGQYYPKVAFVVTPVGLGYVYHVTSYDRALEKVEEGKQSGGDGK